jgi:hypothetical protein
MSLFLSKEVGKHGKLGIWQITESLDELMKMKSFLKKDLLLLNSFSHENRKKEYIVARILVSQLTGKSNVRIVYDKHNKPFLENLKQHISISHSHNLLAIILDGHKTGIDIEMIREKIIRIRDKFMSDAELKSLQKENIAEQITVYWCAKESLYKLYGKKGLAFKKDIFIEPFEYLEKGIIKGWITQSSGDSLMKKSFLLNYEKLDAGGSSYVMAYTLAKSRIIEQ